MFIKYVGALNDKYLNLIGQILAFGGDTIPSGYLSCDGATISRTTYNLLFAVIGTTWGSGDGTTTFNIPDLREVALVGIGTSSRSEGSHDAYTLGQFKDDQVQKHTHSNPIVCRFGYAGGGGIGAAIWSGDNPNTGSNSSGRYGDVTRGKRMGINYIIYTGVESA